MSLTVAGWNQTLASGRTSALRSLTPPRAVELLKENELVKNAISKTSGTLENIKESEAFKSASSGLERARDTLSQTFETTIAPSIQDAVVKVRSAVVGPPPPAAGAIDQPDLSNPPAP